MTQTQGFARVHDALQQPGSTARQGVVVELDISLPDANESPELLGLGA